MPEGLWLTSDPARLMLQGLVHCGQEGHLPHLLGEGARSAELDGVRGLLLACSRRAAGMRTQACCIEAWSWMRSLPTIPLYLALPTSLPDLPACVSAEPVHMHVLPACLLCLPAG